MKKYLQLYNTLKEQILNQTLLSGKQLPTECVIAATYGMSRQTVRQALEMLRRDGYIYSIQGSGSFVAPSDNRSIQTRRIAVITTYFDEYIFPSILRGISQAAVENAYTIEISTTNNSISEEKTILTNILQHPVAGIIVEGTKAALPNPNTAYYQQLAHMNIPIVFINSIYPNLEEENIVSIVTADFNGAYKLASQLITKGHRSIGCIFKSDDAQGLNRFAGFISALVANELQYDDSHFVWFTTETKQTVLCARSTSKLFTSCTAIVCYNDEVVERILPHLNGQACSVQAIGSFDRNLNPALIAPGIEFFSLPHPKDMLGQIAAHKLFSMLEGKTEKSVILPWQEE